ncbi:hypothetical protein XENORESO_022214 [Xenotaenia resolanae]|uniref:Uncharacterized protein n=1 Tax=Xenotaenia resolanae TaxID=208358 RepID=A0ABV0WRR2_9TELE
MVKQDRRHNFFYKRLRGQLRCILNQRITEDHSNKCLSCLDVLLSVLLHPIWFPVHTCNGSLLGSAYKYHLPQTH